MKKEEYALLMLDNMPLKKHFVVAKLVKYLHLDDFEEQKNYAVYEDLITENIIYPSSYEVNEFIDSEEYIKQLKELKWISRKIITKKEALDLSKKLDKNAFLSYLINIVTAQDKKKKIYNSELEKHTTTIKKLKYKKK